MALMKFGKSQNLLVTLDMMELMEPLMKVKVMENGMVIIK